jgi:hypothetical protein
MTKVATQPEAATVIGFNVVATVPVGSPALFTPLTVAVAAAAAIEAARAAAVAALVAKPV